MTRLPNLELLMYKASSIFLQEEEFLLKARKLKNYEILDIEVETFPQTWGNTCTGFDITKDGKASFGGSAMTMEYTTVVHEKRTDFYLVFFGDRPCYAVHNPTKEFYEDLKERHLASLSKSKEVNQK